MDEFAQQLASTLASARPSSNGWLRSACPWCQELLGKRDTKQSFAYNVASGVYRCLRCGSKGCAKDAAVYVGDAQRAKLGKIDAEESEVGFAPSGFTLIDEEPVRSSVSWQHAIRFLDGRGIGEEKRRKAKIGLCLDRNHRVYGRIIIPIFGERGEWLGWIARASVKKHDVPYLYAKGMQRAELCYNAEAVRLETDVPLIVVEGAFDSIYVGEDCSAVLGKPGYAQMRAFLSARRPVVHVADGDAFLESYAMIERLRSLTDRPGRLGCLRLGGGVDPDEVDSGELRRMAQRALNEHSLLSTDPLAAMVDW